MAVHAGFAQEFLHHFETVFRPSLPLNVAAKMVVIDQAMQELRASSSGFGVEALGPRVGIYAFKLSSPRKGALVCALCSRLLGPGLHDFKRAMNIALSVLLKKISNTP